MEERPEAEPIARDSVYYLQLARAARLKAAATTDHDLSLRLREAAVLHERKARQLKRLETDVAVAGESRFKTR